MMPLMNKISGVLLGLTMLFLIFGIGVYNIPWYTAANPVQIIHKNYKPGDNVAIEINRSALVNIQGAEVRELIRLEGADEIEVFKVYQNLEIEKGVKKKIVYWALPTIKTCPHLKGNTYLWRGHIKYKVFGIFERAHHFYSTKFHIKVDTVTNLGEVQHAQ